MGPVHLRPICVGWRPFVVTPRASIELYQVHTFVWELGNRRSLRVVVLDGNPSLCAKRWSRWMHGYVDSWRVCGLTLDPRNCGRKGDIHSEGWPGPALWQSRERWPYVFLSDAYVVYLGYPAGCKSIYIAVPRGYEYHLSRADCIVVRKWEDTSYMLNCNLILVLQTCMFRWSQKFTFMQVFFLICKGWNLN